MSKNLFTRIFSVILVLALVFGMIACARVAPSETSSEETKDEQEKSIIKDTKQNEEPINVSWSIQTSQVQKFRDQDTWANNLWSRLIKDELNINLTVAFSADGSTDAYDNKLNVAIASGDLPDIFKSNDMNVFKMLQSTGQLADLTEVFEEYATPSVKEYRDKFVDSFNGVTVDGRLFAIPRMNDNFHQAPALWIREDWLKNTNSKPPETVEEMVELARLFALGDPDANGVNGDTFGLAINKNLVNPGYANILGLLAAYGVPAYSQNIFFRDGNGDMTFSYIQPGVKDALALLNSMYKEGLLDREFTAKDNANQEEDVAAGRIGMSYANNWGTWYPFNMVFQNENVITHPYPIPTIPGTDYKVGIENNATGQITMVSAKLKNPEAAIKILNLYDATVNDANNPDNFHKFWADEQYRLCPVYIDLPNEVYAADVLNALNKGSDDGLHPAAKPFYDFVVNFENGTDRSANAYGTWGQMSTVGSLQIYLNSYIPDGAMVQSILGSERPQVWTQNYSALETITLMAFTDIITGRLPIEHFDTYVKDWLNAGGQQVLDELDKMYPVR